MRSRRNQTRIEQIEKKLRIENEMKKEQKRIMDIYYGHVIFA